jgi:hypothetical protein
MTDVASWTPEQRADAYLEGALSPEEALAFERDLAERPEVAEALAAALALSQLLEAMPPVHPPPGLEERIAAALPLGRPAPDAPPSSLPTVRAALGGVSWFLRGPAAAVQGGMDGTRPAAAGLSQARWMLGPLAVRRGGEPAPARRPLWSRALGAVGPLVLGRGGAASAARRPLWRRVLGIRA